ncbi:hypothetical protein NIES2135_64640 (plasmid) [Leptolyngbya boryana NIES-2135]|jgi:hypothetical protein|uniref:Uncharacterized protein n=1 Tax=Leptolyngbya boryana NIES-2135 TaxID=1973484 RepID=A0A1Z4JSC8_LEPBY|nr:hypothetical protein LBWT_X3770 [Leptolyngbya boryana IAM M-101]BAS66653.1 hypothetical protein LBDG_X3770 [Leptolyngbya boryana dg5]BAY59587.1 hypothetical protein NIES2135_64640 [Leptolyngbya boryana NIES-2135]
MMQVRSSRAAFLLILSPAHYFALLNSGKLVRKRLTKFGDLA